MSARSEARLRSRYGQGIELRPWTSSKSKLAEDRSEDRARIGETIIVLAYLIAAGSFLALPFAMFSLYSGGMRWIITLLLVTVVAIVGLKVIFPLGERRWESPTPIDAKTHRDQFAPLEEMAERACEGYSYSQKALDERMADAFLEKVRVKRNLQPAEVFRLSEDEGRLARACGDRELASFVAESKAAMARKAEKRGLFQRRGMARQGRVYRERALRVMARMEAWEG